MGGRKRKIAIEKIKEKKVKSVTFTKRRNGLFRKASELCLLSPATQIAVLATPPSSNSHASFYSFGHSSVDDVVSTLLHDLSPPLPTTNQQENRRRLGFWWEDKRFDISENLDELKDATDAITRMLNNVRLRLDSLKSNQRHGGDQQLEDLQLSNSETNSSEVITTEQILRIDEGSSGSRSLVEIEDDQLHIDDFFTDVTIDPF